jgi:hypothetical protein
MTHSGKTTQTSCKPSEASASDALSQHRFGAAASSHLKDESLQQQRRDKRQRCLGHCRGNQWESPAELMLQLDEARRHIDQLLWQQLLLLIPA